MDERAGNSTAAAKMFGSRSEIVGRWSAIMDHRRNDRRMVPASWQTRCIKAGEIHEFILCSPGVDFATPMDDVSYLGFAEIVNGGVLAVGDALWAGETRLGTLHGFDETHWPNHYNILIAADRLQTGVEIGLEVGGAVSLKAA